MCRLAYIPPGVDPEQKEVINLLEFLATMQGKDGVGVGGWTPKNEGRLAKGVDMQPAEAIDKLKDADALRKGVMFHCRAATSGGKLDGLCQPFIFQNQMTVHNGHWTDWKDVLWPLIISKAIRPGDGPINDSAAAAAVAGATEGWGLSWMDNGVFITWNHKQRWPMLILNRGDFCYSALPAKMGGGVIYASQFPYTWPVKVMEFHNDSKAILTPAGPFMLLGNEPFQKRAYYSYGGEYSGGRWKGHGYPLGEGCGV
jgi:hypothetical protein